jgi:thiosulfate/3-mercaptopyruvate sulfurtransferase
LFAEYRQRVTYTTLISTDALAASLDTFIVVDCRFDLADEAAGHRAYLDAHIPGAVYASLAHDLSSTPTGRSGRHPLPSIERAAETFGRLGIDRSRQVVAYDQETGMFASRLWWMLRYLGHDAVAVLDGGWTRWTRERRPTWSGEESRAAASFVASPRPAMRVDVDQVTASLATGDRILVDARGAERFEGRTEPLDRVAGHIPGARNRPYKSNMAEDGTLLPAETLRAEFDRLLDHHDPAHAIMYCGSGVSACHNLLAMEHAGLPGAALYAGSWSEWSADPTRPVETGPARR